MTRQSPGGRTIAVPAAGFVLAFLALLSAPVPARAAPPVTDIERAGEVVTDRKASDRARIRTARRLAESKDPRAGEYLLSACSDRDNSAALRAALLGLLPRLPDKDATARYLGDLLNDVSEAAAVRGSAAASLGAMARLDSLPVLRRHESDSEVEVRLKVRLALLGFPPGVTDHGKLWRALLADAAAPPPLRVRAARELGRLREARATSELLAALAEEPLERPDLSPFGAAMTGRGGAAENVPAAAARALGELGDGSTTPALLSRAAAGNEELRVAVFEALARLRAESGLPAARRALAEDESMRVRRWAAFLLKELKDPQTLADLRRALAEDEDPGVRLQVVQALEALNDRESVEKIRSALAKENLKEVRAAMEQALVTLAPATETAN